MTETSPLGTVALPPAAVDAGQRRVLALPRSPGPVPRRRRGPAHRRRTARSMPWDGESVGELEVRGPWITASYYERHRDARPAESGKFSDDGWLRTGDVGTLEHGRASST